MHIESIREYQYSEIFATPYSLRHIAMLHLACAAYVIRSNNFLQNIQRIADSNGGIFQKTWGKAHG